MLYYYLCQKIHKCSCIGYLIVELSNTLGLIGEALFFWPNGSGLKIINESGLGLNFLACFFIRPGRAWVRLWFKFLDLFLYWVEPG